MRVWPWVAVVVVAAVVRTVGMGWGLPRLYHCDERRVVLSATRYLEGKGAGPSDGVYAPLPSYVAKVLDLVVGHLRGSPASVARVLRGLSALASVGTCLVTGWIASRWWGTLPGLVAGLGMALSPGAIREAHFATVDSLLSFALVVALAVCLVGPRNQALTGNLLAAALGLAVAVKLSALPAVAALLLVGPFRRGLSWWRGLAVRCGIFCAVFSLLAWDMVAHPRPYVFWGAATFLWRTGVLRPGWSLAFTTPTPWAGLVSFLWMAGPGLALGGLAGLAALVRSLRTRTLPVAILSLPAVVDCLSAIPFVRYALPLVPVAALASAALVASLRRHGVWAALILVGATLPYGLWYAAVYLSPDTRDQAGAWLAERWSPGEVVLLDGTDDLVPLPGLPHEAQRPMEHPGLALAQEPVDPQRLRPIPRLAWALAEWGAVTPKLERILREARDPPRPPPEERRRALVRQAVGATWLVTTGTELARYASHPHLFSPEREFYQDLRTSMGFQVQAVFKPPHLAIPWVPPPEPSWFFFDHPTVTVLRRR